MTVDITLYFVSFLFQNGYPVGPSTSAAAARANVGHHQSNGEVDEVSEREILIRFSNCLLGMVM